MPTRSIKCILILQKDLAILFTNTSKIYMSYKVKNIFVYSYNIQMEFIAANKEQKFEFKL